MTVTILASDGKTTLGWLFNNDEQLRIHFKAGAEPREDQLANLLGPVELRLLKTEDRAGYRHVIDAEVVQLVMPWPAPVGGEHAA